MKVRAAEAEDAGAALQLMENWQFEAAHGLMWLNCFLCGLPWTAKPSFLSFSPAALHIPDHRLPILLIQPSFCQEGYSNLQSMSVHVLLGSSTTAKACLKKTLARSTCLPMHVQVPSCVIGLDLWALTGLIITKSLYLQICR